MLQRSFLISIACRQETAKRTVYRDTAGRRDVWRCGRRSGLTLLEVVAATFLVGCLLLATMRAVGAVFRTRMMAEQGLKGERLARELVAEIVRCPYEDPDDTPVFGRESGERNLRVDFDDVDDYRGWEASPPETLDGSAIESCAGWTRQVQVRRVSVDYPGVSVFWDTGLKRIRVTVTSPAGERFELTALRAASGALELRPPLDTTYVTGVTGGLKLNAQNGTSRAIAPVLNHSEDN